MTLPEATIPPRIRAAVIWFCALFAFGAAIFPFLRARLLYTINYNEGWNVYTTSQLANHETLYAAKYAWTTVNYPMLSFVIVSALHHVTHDFLFTARALSLLGLLATSILVGAVVRKLGGSPWASAIAGIFCLAYFCMSAGGYTGSDDPQLLSQGFFVAGFYVYLLNRKSWSGIAAAAALFVFAGCIKHSQIDIPLAVLIDLLLISWLRAIWFSVVGIALAAVGVVLMIHFGGPFFLAEMASPRAYILTKIFDVAKDDVLPMALPIILGGWMAWQVRKDSVRRVAAILFAVSLVVAIYFSGGKGTAENIYFTVMIASAILDGFFFDDLERGRWEWARKPNFALIAAVVLFASLYFPGGRNPIRNLHIAEKKQANFKSELAILQSHPGPAICEDLLLCNQAGKPFIYDPFNATSLIVAGKLDGGLIERNLAEHKYSAVQISQPMKPDSEHFTPAIQAAIRANYAPAFDDGLDVVYLPKQ